MSRNSKIRGIKVKDDPDDTRNPLVSISLSDEIDEFTNSYSAWNQLLHDRRSPFPTETWGKIKTKVENHFAKIQKATQAHTSPEVDETALRLLRQFEPFLNGEGKLFVVMLNDGSKISVEEICRRYQVSSSAIRGFMAGIEWCLPGDPQISPDPTLLDDLKIYLRENFYLADERMYNVLADWAICSFLREFTQTATRLIVFGETRSGKTRTMNTIQAISYRALDLLLPTVSSLYRTIEKCQHPTLCLDEYQDLPKDRAQEINAIIKGGFNPGYKVMRSSGEDFEQQSFHVFCPVLIGTEDLPPVEIMNRSILLASTEKPTGAPINRRIDRVKAAALRTRLLAFRVRCMSGAIDMRLAIETAEKLALTPIQIGDGGGLVELDDRSIEKASELLIPEAIFNLDGKSVLQLLAESQMFANDELENTEPANIFKALKSLCDQIAQNSSPTVSKEEIIRMMTQTTTRAVCERYQQMLKENGDNAKVSTLHVTCILKKMGFTLAVGPLNTRIFEQRTFRTVFPASLKKYGMGRGNQ
jgi:hypothetical protein